MKAAAQLSNERLRRIARGLCCYGEHRDCDRQAALNWTTCRLHYSAGRRLEKNERKLALDKLRRRKRKKGKGR